MLKKRTESPNAGEVRSHLPAHSRQRSLVKALALFLPVAALYMAALTGCAVAPYWWLKLACAGLNAFFLALLFVIGHDACHGAFTPYAWLNALLGRVALMPSWHPYAGWEHAHNHVHHGWTNLCSRDYAWAPKSKAQYDALPRWRQRLERFYRSALGFGPYYFIEVYLKKTIFPSREFRGRMNMLRFRGDCLLVAAFMGVQGAYLVLCPQWLGVEAQAVESLVYGQWLPFVIWNYLIGFLIYLHHTHPRIPWFSRQEEWSFYLGQIRGTAHVKFPGPINWMVENIMEHTAHHADPRVPLYHLGEAQRRLAEAFPDDVIEHKFSIRGFFYSLRTCQLYDYENHNWISFAGEQTSSRTIPAHCPGPPVAPLVLAPVRAEAA